MQAKSSLATALAVEHSAGWYDNDVLDATPEELLAIEFICCYCSDLADNYEMLAVGTQDESASQQRKTRSIWLVFEAKEPILRMSRAHPMYTSLMLTSPDHDNEPLPNDLVTPFEYSTEQMQKLIRTVRGDSDLQQKSKVWADCWLRYDNGHWVLICSAHGYAISSIHGHLLDQHLDIKSKERNAIVARYAGVEIRGAEDGGFACWCGLLTTSWKWLRVHFNKEHPTWNVNSLIRYFCVTMTGDDTNTAAATPGIEAALGTGGQGGPPGGVEDDELVAGIKERWACGQDWQEEIQKVLADGAAKHEITNWLRRSGWMPGLGEEEARRLIAATDRLFFNRCVAGLRSMPLMTRLLLASPHPKDAHSRPFGPLQEKTSMDRYVTYWKRFLCYCLRVLPLDEATLLERYSFQFTPGQRHFIAVLRIDGELGQLRPAHLFTYMLAGLVYVGRALLSEFAIPARERGTIKDLEGRFAANRQCNLMYFMGKPIAMDAIQSMVAEMITNAEDILWRELIFKEGHNVRFTIPLNTIEDDLTYTHRGKSFIHTNDLEGKEVEMLEDLVRSRRKGEFLDPGGKWRWEGIRNGMARGDEIGGLRLVNAHFNSLKVIPRIVPPRVGQLLAIYIVYRHIAITISKKHTRGKQANTKGDSNNDLGLDLNEAEQYKVPDDLAATHSTATAANYGVTADILKRLTADSLEVFGRVSRRWHRFLNLDRAPCTALTALRKRRASMAAKPEETLQEDAIQQAAARETPLIAVLPTSSSKSLVFIVPAILARARVTIVVAPFAELKRQLVSRCADAGLECKQWPEAQDVWPRAADLSVRGRLDRIVINECHLTFTAADEYRGKLRDLREFKEVMQLQNPLYIQASSHRLNVRYSVVRVKNGRGIAKVKKLVLSHRQDLAKGEKGVVYCASHAKCKVLAQQLGCHYYHGLPSDSNAHFFAQRKEGFQAWLEGTTLYIVATAALGTGIDMPGIKHAVICDNCEQESRVWKTWALQRLESALEEIEELGKPGCRVCWMFKGAMEARH
ncbi:hypothetical protein CC79DRAFT_1351456 [Sarocladium strictum]